MFIKRVKNKEIMIGTHVNSSDICSGKIAGHAGYDYIWLDMEHNCMSYEVLLHHIMVIKATGTAVVVRAPQNDLTATKKIMEMGPDGIIFPMVKTAQEAERLLNYTLYPPYGNRGFGPANAVNYGYRDVKEYVEQNHKTMARFIQIEHKNTIENLDEIMKNPYIDGYIIGPQDLSGSYHMLGDIYSEKITQIIGNVVKKLHEADKYVGLSIGDVSPESLRHWRELDIDMISAGLDYDFIRMGMMENRKHMEKLWKN